MYNSICLCVMVLLYNGHVKLRQNGCMVVRCSFHAYVCACIYECTCVEINSIPRKLRGLRFNLPQSYLGNGYPFITVIETQYRGLYLKVLSCSLAEGKFNILCYLVAPFSLSNYRRGMFCSKHNVQNYHQ